MKIYIVKVSTRNLNPIFGAWRDEEQAKGFINSVKELQSEDTSEFSQKQITEYYYNKVRPFFLKYFCDEGKQSFIQTWLAPDLDGLMDAFVGKAVSIQSFEIQDEFYENLTEIKRMKTLAFKKYKENRL